MKRINDKDLLDLLGDDAHNWAEEFCSRFVVCGEGVPMPDQEGLMIAWFANAIESGRGRR